MRLLRSRNRVRRLDDFVVAAIITLESENLGQWAAGLRLKSRQSRLSVATIALRRIHVQVRNQHDHGSATRLSGVALDIVLQ
jgi:hypothetical protein